MRTPPPQMSDNVRRLAWPRDYVVVIHGGGAAGQFWTLRCPTLRRPRPPPPSPPSSSSSPPAAKTWGTPRVAVGSKRRRDANGHLEISRWPIEKNSDNPFFVFSFTLAEVPLRKKSEKCNNVCSYLTANRPKLFHIFCQCDQFPSLPKDARVAKTVSCL